MDKLWTREGYQLRLSPYGVIATGEEIGMVDVVANAETTASINRVSIGYQYPAILYRTIFILTIFITIIFLLNYNGISVLYIVGSWRESFCIGKRYAIQVGEIEESN